MSKKEYDIAVAYRVYPMVSKTPPIYANDKFKLVELCFDTFVDATRGLRVKLFVLLDSCPDEYESIFTKRWDSEDLEFIKMDSAGNPLTFKKQIEILSSQQFSEFVYFAEDDYFYFPMALSEMLVFLKTVPNAHFAAAYDHPDLYDYKLHNYPKKRINHNGRDWQRIATTCLTFLTRKSVLIDTKKMFVTYSRKNYDASMWMSLTRKQVYNFPLMIKLMFQSKEMARIYFKLWYFGLFHNVFAKKYSLWTPVPALATHLDSTKLAPGIDWNSVFLKKIKEIG